MFGSERRACSGTRLPGPSLHVILINLVTLTHNKIHSEANHITGAGNVMLKPYTLKWSLDTRSSNKREHVLMKAKYSFEIHHTSTVYR